LAPSFERAVNPIHIRRRYEYGSDDQNKRERITTLDRINYSSGKHLTEAENCKMTEVDWVGQFAKPSVKYKASRYLEQRG
jgi:hypothetical protein